jgi:hypothetical protein
MRIGFKHLSQQCIIGLRTFSPIRFTRWSQRRRSIGSGGPRLMVVKVGASNWEISASKSTIRNQNMNFTNQLTKPMEKSPSLDTNGHSASQEIPYLSWNQKVHHHIYMSSPPVWFLSNIKQGYFKFKTGLYILYTIDK